MSFDVSALRPPNFVWIIFTMLFTAITIFLAVLYSNRGYIDFDDNLKLKGAWITESNDLVSEICIDNSCTNKLKKVAFFGCLGTKYDDQRFCGSQSEFPLRLLPNQIDQDNILDIYFLDDTFPKSVKILNIRNIIATENTGGKKLVILNL